jgi:hypothetical protein
MIGIYYNNNIVMASTKMKIGQNEVNQLQMPVKRNQLEIRISDIWNFVLNGGAQSNDNSEVYATAYLPWI